MSGRPSPSPAAPADAPTLSPPRTLFVVSAAVPRDAGPREGPSRDYHAVARALDATVLDYGDVEQSPAARAIARRAGLPVAQAWLAFRRRGAFDAILTDGEHIGIPLAMLLKAAGARPTHVTIGHRIAAAKKRPFFRWLKLHTHIDRIAVHARRQLELAVSHTGIPADRLAFVPYQVDTRFWRPPAAPPERLICSVGLEYRDYPTLFRAVEGLDARVVVAAASYWSKRRNSAAAATPPPNVTIGAYDYLALREVYARAAVVAIPLADVDFQAGITAILEAMAMGKPVVVTHTRGQTDVVVDRRVATRGTPLRPRPESLLAPLAAQAGLELAPNGLYVPPDDPAALREALAHLLDHRGEREELGGAGRRLVEGLMTVDHYAARLRDLVLTAYAARSGTLPAERPWIAGPTPAGA
jgi:glycosyltransferase involved in cell wall biosynthesis